MTQEPNAFEDEEFYEDANDEFPSVGTDLIVGAHSQIKDEVLGRLVAIWPRENGSEIGQSGKPYPYTDGIVLVLDDGPDGEQSTPLVGPAPQELPLRFSTTGIQSRLAPRLDGMTAVRRNKDTGEVIAPARPQKYLPMIGRINARPAKQKGNNPPIGIRMMTDDERPIAKRYKDEIKEISARLKAKDEAKSDAEAFE